MTDICPDVKTKITKQLDTDLYTPITCLIIRYLMAKTLTTLPLIIIYVFGDSLTDFSISDVLSKWSSEKVVLSLSQQ